MALGTSAAFAMPAIASAFSSGQRNEQAALSDAVARSEHWKNSALVVVDMQNDFVRTGAPLEVASARDTIGTHKALIQAFRKRSLPIVFTKFISHPHYYILWDWSPQCKPPTRCCWKGHERLYSDIAGKRQCTEIIDELRPESGDIIIEKHGYGAFHDTPLERILRSFGLNSVVITGTVTQICVEETAREAFHHGFRATLVEDAVSSFAPDLHDATLKNFAMKFGWVASTEAIVSSIA